MKKKKQKKNQNSVNRRKKLTNRKNMKILFNKTNEKPCCNTFKKKSETIFHFIKNSCANQA